jgi:hypothetical protein
VKYFLVINLLFFSAVLAFADSPAAVSATAAGKLFPGITLQSLDDIDISLPFEVTSKAQVSHIIVTFKRPDDKDMETWVSPFREKYESNPRTAYYSLALVGDVGFINGLIFSGMQGGAAPEMRKHLLVYFRDKEPYKKILGIVDDSLIYNYILDQNGAIRLVKSGKAATQADIYEILTITESLLKP